EAQFTVAIVSVLWNVNGPKIERSIISLKDRAWNFGDEERTCAVSFDLAIAPMPFTPEKQNVLRN
ncbi:MAG: hypothetical protein ACYCW6_02595, partial [Candidatus Xenobia bacterium]